MDGADEQPGRRESRSGGSDGGGVEEAMAQVTEGGMEKGDRGEGERRSGA